MNERKALTPGTIITLRQDGYTRQYRIINVIGEGTTCIVYEAERMGSVRSPRCRIKECYPRHTQTERTGDVISWKEPNERKMAYQRMQKAHDLMVSLRDDETVGNHIPTTELFDGNGTLYSVMEINHAGTDTIHQIDNVYDLLDIMRVLTEIVSCIHEKGYLHLDLKPANFLARVDPTAGVWMFDVDSFEEISSIREKRVHGISYSKGYAPPEQQSANLDQISEKADIYAIGAILFESIMGRLPGSLDRGSYPEWEFEGPLFEKTNPIVKVRLREIFKKTLALNPRKRYDTARELAGMLAEVRDLVQEPFLLSNVPTSLQTFVGREQELQVLESALQKRIAVIQGVGGIGKSELAKRYAHLHSQEYQAVIYSHYKGSVEETMDGITIQNFYGYAEKREILQRLLNKNTLWVIDGFDTNESGDIHLLEELECDIIITSRRSWDDYFGEASIVLHTLFLPEQISLFETELCRSLSDYEVADVKEILNYIEGYTLLIPLLAKQVRKGYYSIRDMMRELRNGGIQGVSTGKVKHLKDGMALSGPVWNILCGLFNVAQFEEQEESILAVLSLCKNYLVRQDNLIDWLGRECLVALDELISSGWVQREQRKLVTYISMHCVLLEVVSNALNPTIEMCPGLKAYLERVATKLDERYNAPVAYAADCEWEIEEVLFTITDEEEKNAAIDLVSDIVDGCTWSNSGDAEFWTTLCKKLVCVIYYGNDTCFSKISKSMERLVSHGSNISGECRVNACLIQLRISINQKRLNAASCFFEDLKVLANGHPDKEAVLFKGCFSLYQFLCTGSSETHHEKMFGMQRFASSVRETLKDLVECWDGDGSSAWIEGRSARLPKEIVQSIYDDFCIRAFGKPDGGTAVPINGVIIDCGWYKKDESSEVIPLNEDARAERSELRTYLGTVWNALESVHSILEETYEFVVQDVFDYVPLPLAEDQRQEALSALQKVDIHLGFQSEFLTEEKAIVIRLLESEAKFGQFYARLEEWNSFNKHADTLLDFYEELMRLGHYNADCGVRDESIGHILYGYATLLFESKHRLRGTCALDFIHALTLRVEEIVQNDPRARCYLRDLYSDGINIALREESTEMEKFFKDRYQAAVMSTLFSKDLDKRIQELKKQLDEVK